MAGGCTGGFRPRKREIIRYLETITQRKEYEILLNRTAREEMKLKLEADIMRDIIVCNLMKEDARVYLLELKKIIDDTLNKIEVARYEKMYRL